MQGLLARVLSGWPAAPSRSHPGLAEGATVSLVCYLFLRFLMSPSQTQFKSYVSSTTYIECKILKHTATPIIKHLKLSNTHMNSPHLCLMFSCPLFIQGSELMIAVDSACTYALVSRTTPNSAFQCLRFIDQLFCCSYSRT